MFQDQWRRQATTGIGKAHRAGEQRRLFKHNCAGIEKNPLISESHRKVRLCLDQDVLGCNTVLRTKQLAANRAVEISDEFQTDPVSDSDRPCAGIASQGKVNISGREVLRIYYSDRFYLAEIVSQSA